LIGTLGKIEIEGTLEENGEEKKIKCEVGTGFSDYTRKTMWKDYGNGKLVGKVVEVKYQSTTEDGCLRFPVFSKMRPDKDEE
jgi:ATP-dependent DNA ligase